MCGGLRIQFKKTLIKATTENILRTSIPEKTSICVARFISVAQILLGDVIMWYQYSDNEVSKSIVTMLLPEREEQLHL